MLIQKLKKINPNEYKILIRKRISSSHLDWTLCLYKGLKGEINFIPPLKSIMTQASLQLIKTFLKYLNGNDWNILQPLYVKPLRFLQYLKIDTVFLHAATTFWDTRDHVFRFNGQEICPLMPFWAILLILLP